MELEDFDWEEMVEYWNLEVEVKCLSDFKGTVPDHSKIGRYHIDGGNYNYSQWWKNEVSDEYKQYIQESKKVEEENQDAKLDAIRKYMFESYANRKSDKVAHKLREFIRKLYENSIDYNDAPVWKSLLEIERTDILFQFTSPLLPLMWV